jgi:hypothetical protein
VTLTSLDCDQKLNKLIIMYELVVGETAGVPASDIHVDLRNRITNL